MLTHKNLILWAVAVIFITSWCLLWFNPRTGHHPRVIPFIGPYFEPEGCANNVDSFMPSCFAAYIGFHAALQLVFAFSIFLKTWGGDESQTLLTYMLSASDFVAHFFTYAVYKTGYSCTSPAACTWDVVLCVFFLIQWILWYIQVLVIAYYPNNTIFLK